MGGQLTADGGFDLLELRSWRKAIASIIALTLLVFLAYWPALFGPFVYDDSGNIVDNYALHLDDISPGALWRAMVRSPTVAAPRPIANLTFVLNYRLGGLNPVTYHVTNILIHVGASIGLFLLLYFVRHVVDQDGNTPSKFGIPLVLTLIWALNPVQTQAVAYVVQRMTSLCAAFYIWSLVCYLRARLGPRPGCHHFFALACVLYLLALGTKELAVSFPAVLFLSEVMLLKTDVKTALRRTILWFIPGVLLLISSAEFRAGVTQLVVSLETGSTVEGKEWTLLERWLTEARALWYYISLFLFPAPSRLSVVHDFPLSTSLGDPPTTATALVLLLASVVVTGCLSRRWPSASFGWLFFLVASGVEVFHPQLALVFEHRIYLPSIGLVLLLQSMICKLSKAFSVPFLLGVLILPLLIATFERSGLWASELSLFEDTVKKAPLSSPAHNSLGAALMRQGKVDEAIAHYSESLRLDPSSVRTHYNLGVAAERQGAPDKAVAHYIYALSILPTYRKAHHRLGNLLIRQGKVDEAMAHYSEILRLDPEDVETHNDLGNLLTERGNVEEAVKHYQRAIETAPNFANAHVNLGIAMARQGKVEEAIVCYRKALRIRPDHKDAHYSLGVALFAQGKVDEAMAHYSEVLRLDPDHVESHNNLGNLLAERGNVEEAVKHYQKAIQSKPEDVVAHINLANLLGEQGRREEAIYHYTEALRIQPDSVEIRRLLAAAKRLKAGQRKLSP